MKRQNLRKMMLFVSMLLFPVTMRFFSPMEAVEAAAGGVAAGSLVVFVTMFLTSIVFRRGWCGWLCPGGGLQETCMRINDRKVRSKKNDAIKFIIWIPWITAIVILAVNSGGLIGIDMLHGIPNGVFVLERKVLIVYYIFLVLIAGLSIAIGRRAFCRWVCWMSPFMIIGSRIGETFGLYGLRLVARSDLCSRCGLCKRYCPMGLDVDQMAARGSMYNAECVLCGECVDRCTRGAIKFSFKPGTSALPTTHCEERVGNSSFS